MQKEALSGVPLSARRQILWKEPSCHKSSPWEFHQAGSIGSYSGEETGNPHHAQTTFVADDQSSQPFFWESGPPSPNSVTFPYEVYIPLALSLVRVYLIWNSKAISLIWSFSPGYCPWMHEAYVLIHYFFFFFFGLVNLSLITGVSAKSSGGQRENDLLPYKADLD